MFLPTTNIALVGPLGVPELAIILLILLFLFGAKKIPQFAKGLGQSLGQFRKGREEVEDEHSVIPRK